MKQNLDRLITHWQKQEIITAKQAGLLRADVALDSTQRTKNRFILALSTLGALGLGTGVILFVSSNWSELSSGVKLAMAVLLPIVPLGLAYHRLLIKKTYISLGRGSLLLGILMIGAAMAIIGQVYNLESEYLRFLTMWAVLGAPFAYFFRRTEGLVLIALLLGAAIFAFFSKYADSSGNHEVVLASFPLAYIAYGALLYGLGRLGSNTNDWQPAGRFFRTIGAKLALASLFLTTFSFYAESLFRLGLNASEGATRLFLNLFYVAFLVFVLYKAIKVEAENVISAVFFWFGAFILFRYFDFFWDMLPTSLFFIAGGVILIGGAIVLEKQRQRLLRKFDQESVVNKLKYDE